MDVISLLNTSSQARAGPSSREQSPSPTPSDQSSSGSSTEPRTGTHAGDEEKSHKSRRPWNADGYSLPLSIDTKAPLHLQSRFRSPSERLESPSSCTESGASPHSRAPSLESSAETVASHPATSASNASTFRSPRLAHDSCSSPVLERAAEEMQNSERPRHKFSDSHSSLSSYASSVSGFHSRISSVTTVSGMTEMPTLDSKLGQLPESIEIPMLGTIQPPSPMYPSLQQNLDYGFSRPHCARLLSPTEILSQSRSQADSYFAPSSKLHKRTVSAPNCRPASMSARLTPTKQSYPVLPPPHSILDLSRRLDTQEMSREQSPVMAGRLESGDVLRHGSGPRQESELEAGGSRRHSAISYSDHSRSVSLDPARGMSQAPAPIPEDASPPAETTLNAEACCMFVENCNTGSQLRKAISHLFGRNKNCTQRIPKHVWVYYCRKHYQRVRYRNAKTYPLTQMELVKVQIHRLQAWSVKNQNEGQGSHIESWEFSLRKREQKRLDGEAGPGDDSDDENGSGSGGTSVPSWIVQSLGKGYRTEQILEIVDRLYDELEKGHLTQVPEVEFLPNIVEEGNEGAAKPGRGRRNNSTTSTNGAKAPKRKVSDVPMLAEQASSRHHGYPGQHDDAAAGQISPSEKRLRVDNAGGFSPTRAATSSFMQPLENLPLRSAPANRYLNGGAAEHHLPRAPYVVPKMHFAPESREEDRSPGHQMRYPLNGHASSDDQGRSYFYGLSSTYGQMPSQPDHAREPSASQLGLPSITPQGPMTFQGDQRQQHPKPSSIDSTGYGPHRPMHQRSASAFSFADRRGIPRSPSSAGLEGQTGFHGLGLDASGHSRYGPGLDAPRTFHGSHGPRPHGHGHSQSLSLNRSPFHAQPMMHSVGRPTPAMTPDVAGRH